MAEAVFKDGHNHLESNVASPHNLMCIEPGIFSGGSHSTQDVHCSTACDSKTLETTYMFIKIERIYGIYPYVVYPYGRKALPLK